MDPLNRWLLLETAKRFPRKAIQVLGGFLDGSEVHLNGPVMGLQPEDWDGEIITVDFR